mgnify:CR=1 FL=1
MTEQRIQHGGLDIAQSLYDLINLEVIPGSGVEAADFWAQFEQVVAKLTPRNQALLAKRDELQAKIDAWHRANPGFDRAAYKSFLKEIGYLVEEGADFSITTVGHMHGHLAVQRM